MQTKKLFIGNIKGPPGEPGGISEVIAKVGTGTGIPTVDVKLTGESSDRTIELDFDGLKGTPAKISSVTATTDGLHSEEPTIDVSVTDGGDGGQNLDFSFLGLRGERGESGRDAKIVTATATSDATHLDQPTVDVTVGGEPGAQSLAMDLKGFVGAPGRDAKIASATATVDGTHSDSPTCEVTVEGEPGSQRLVFAFSGIVGPEAMVKLATEALAGIVKPDGTTLKVSEDGTLSAQLEGLAKSDELERVKSDLQAEVETLLSGVYKAKGSSTFDGLPEPSTETLGFVYDVSEAFTTDGRFISPDEEHPAGTNVVVVETGDGEYRYDCLSGIVDLSEYVRKTDSIAEAVHASSADRADSSDTSGMASKLGDATVGSETLGIYLDNGVPKTVRAMTSIDEAVHSLTSDVAERVGEGTVGSEGQPVYIDEGVPTAIPKVSNAASADVATKLGSISVGSSGSPIYLNGGIPTEVTKVSSAAKADSATEAETAAKLGSGSVGDESTPIYLKDGVPTPTASIADVEHAKKADEATKATSSDRATTADSAATAERFGSEDVGSETLPVYLLKGVPTAVTKVAVAAKADSADKATSATSADKATTADSATTATRVLGFTGGSTGPVDWGIQTGATVYTCGTPGGGNIEFRDNCPEAGGVSLKVDGEFYAVEGSKRCFHEGDVIPVECGGTGTSTGKVKSSESADRATVADAIGSESVGSASQPVYIRDGIPVEVDVAQLLRDNIATIRAALGIVTTTQNGLVPQLPADPGE